MRRRHFLSIDFARPSQRRRWPQWAIAALGIALLVIATLNYQQSRKALRDAQAQQRAELTEAAASHHSSVGERTRVLESARKVVPRLAVPWPGLLREMAELAGTDIGLLAITPDPAAGQIRIEAQARTPAAMLAYVERLSTSKNFFAPALRQHQIVEDESGKQHVEFEVQAEWVAQGSHR